MNGIRATVEPLISELANEGDLIPLVESYVSRLPQRAAAVEAASYTVDLKTVERLALDLTESAGSYGFPSITDAARKIERIARTRCRLDDLAEESALLVDLCKRARATDHPA